MGNAPSEEEKREESPTLDLTAAALASMPPPAVAEAPQRLFPLSTQAINQISQMQVPPAAGIGASTTVVPPHGSKMPPNSSMTTTRTVHKGVAPPVSKSAAATKKGAKKKDAKRKWKRRTSSSLTTKKAKRQRVVSDDRPDRLVNPLTEWAQGGRAYDLLPLLDLYYPNDTYSLSYQARLLGYKVSVNNHNSDKKPVEMNPSKLVLQQDTNYQTIPPLGTFANHVWKNTDGGQIDVLDPLYELLLQGQSDPANCQPTTPAQHAGLVQTATRTRFEPLVQLARDCCCLPSLRVTTLDQVQHEQEEVTHEHWNNPAITANFGLFAMMSNQPAGFVAYRFYWQPTHAAISELILHIMDIRNTKCSYLQNDHDEFDESLCIVLVSLALEHARASHVWYGTICVPPNRQDLFTTYFCMNRIKQDEQGVHLVCDLHQCSYRYAFLLYKQRQEEKQHESSSSKVESQETTEKQRWLMRLPNVEEAKASLAVGSPERSKRTSSRKPSLLFGGATGPVRQATVGLRAKLTSNDHSLVDLVRLQASGQEGESIRVPTFYSEPSVQVMRTFTLQSSTPKEAEEPDEILQELMAKQKELEALEKGLEPSLHSLMTKAIEERREYESPEAVQKRQEEKRILTEHTKMLERRKQMDEACQKQLEQDMDAVCAICNDGEVAPDNQILFCEACNVAIHQMCYGIDRVPEGDYYCMACQYLGRNKSMSGPTRDTNAPKLAAAPLPICCELCPVRQGAFIRTDMPLQGEQVAFGKWVHVVCAKWQGLNFVDNRNTDLVEDVTELKSTFRQYGIKCYLCQSERGAMNQCRYQGCERWIHVTCARAAGTCDVVHGEDIRGPVETNPWTLMCPEHSNIKSVPKGCVPVEKLLEAAKEFPPEPKPDPAPVVPKPFNTITGEERKALLADPDYERALLVELTTKKFFGVRCEVCDQIEESSVNLTRCSVCAVVFCDSCKLDCDDTDGNFKCAKCAFVSKKAKEGDECEEPSCAACYQKTGWLRHGFAKPVSKKTHWNANPKEFKKSMFCRDLWVHSLCTYWNSKLMISNEDAEVDFSNVIMSNGRGLIQGNRQCFVCGHYGGLKLQCEHEGCHTIVDGKKSATYFHITCARQCGLEVNSEDLGRRINFFVKCYKHGGNEFNLRARLEDLMEIEKRRAGKRLAKADATMNFAHASRLLKASILVMRMLGWAWRWSEWWVDYDSSWEPLLEPGQKEENMTQEELKIVESSRESRCQDARRCRLSAFSAALRERKYDTEEDFDRKALDRALRAVLNTKSLVGPLEAFEIDFLADWMGRAYRSKSRLLGFGGDKIVVSDNDFCKHMEDGSPKYELGGRPIPGKQEVDGEQVFEKGVEEVDDFLKTEMIEDELRKSPRRRGRAAAVQSTPEGEPKTPKAAVSHSKRKREETDYTSGSKSSAVSALAPSAVKKRRGRPPRDRSQDSMTTRVEQTGSAPSTGGKRRGRPPKRLDDHMTPSSEATSGVKRRGRPPRVGIDESSLASGGASLESYPSKRRGRPPKNRYIEDESSTRTGSEGSSVPKRRGRPPKNRDVDSSSKTFINSEASTERKRIGRPPKNRNPEGLSSASTSSEGLVVRKRIGRPPKYRGDDTPVETPTVGKLSAAEPFARTRSGRFAPKAYLNEGGTHLDTDPAPARARPGGGRGGRGRGRGRGRGWGRAAAAPLSGNNDGQFVSAKDAITAEGDALSNRRSARTRSVDSLEGMPGAEVGAVSNVAGKGNIEGTVEAKVTAHDDKQSSSPPRKKRFGRPPRSRDPEDADLSVQEQVATVTAGLPDDDAKPESGESEVNVASAASGKDDPRGAATKVPDEEKDTGSGVGLDSARARFALGTENSVEAEESTSNNQETADAEVAAEIAGEDTRERGVKIASTIEPSHASSPRPKRGRRKTEVTPKPIVKGVSSYDMVKRRRRNPAPTLNMTDMRGKSYKNSSESSSRLSQRLSDEVIARRGRNNDDELPIAQLVAQSKKASETNDGEKTVSKSKQEVKAAVAAEPPRSEDSAADDTPQKRGRRRGKAEAARFIL